MRGTQLPSIRSLHPYLPPPPSVASGSMPSPNPNPSASPEMDNDFDRDEDEGDEPPKKKRRRQALSCTECKRRKIRCDRTQPCAPCVRRGDQAKCVWHVVESVSERYVSYAEHEALRARVDALETFVSHLPPGILATMPPLPGPPSSSAAGTPPSVASSFVSPSMPAIQPLPSLQPFSGPSSSRQPPAFFQTTLTPTPPPQAFPPHVFQSSEETPRRGGRRGRGNGGHRHARQPSGSASNLQDLMDDGPGPSSGAIKNEEEEERTDTQRRLISPSLPPRPFTLPGSLGGGSEWAHQGFPPHGHGSFPGAYAGSSGSFAPAGMPASGGDGGRRGREGSEGHGSASGSSSNASGSPSFQSRGAVMSSSSSSTRSWGSSTICIPSSVPSTGFHSVSVPASSVLSLPSYSPSRIGRRPAARPLYALGDDEDSGVAVAVASASGLLSLGLSVKDDDDTLALGAPRPGLAHPTPPSLSLLALAIVCSPDQLWCTGVILWIPARRRKGRGCETLRSAR
ncbi:hypothetical protein FB45DRAFT_392393 [Roridomyces roridus]|uniref:Zn(2)-C6 fungal-type domain-containing protein n=1 Tax=Roridomyces roridus TaxID=1738132 RepID=A0AAD7B2M1_9AGAR|nr:hypothetical protein FB45DRAFT_392393 [Roridomyces roridus]